MQRAPSHCPLAWSCYYIAALELSFWTVVMLIMMMLAVVVVMVMVMVMVTVTAKTRHCAMPTPHTPSDFAARHSGGRNLGHLQLPEVAPEAASARPIPAHATGNPGALVWPSSKQDAGRLYQLLPSVSQAIGRHIQFFVSS